MIHCIGNSHVSMFSNFDYLNFNFINNNFKSYYLGPVIAYNFYEHHLPLCIDYIKTIDKMNDTICFIVGEVDCRLHLPQKADELKITDEQNVKICVDKFFETYKYLSNLGYKCLVWGTHPTTTSDHNMNDMDNPIYGSMIRRNNICILWNSYLKQLSQQYNLPYKSIYQYLVNDNNETEMKYFNDYCHLNSSLVYNFILKELEDFYENNISSR